MTLFNRSRIPGSLRRTWSPQIMNSLPGSAPPRRGRSSTPPRFLHGPSPSGLAGTAANLPSSPHHSRHEGSGRGISRRRPGRDRRSGSWSGVHGDQPGECFTLRIPIEQGVARHTYDIPSVSKFRQVTSLCRRKRVLSVMSSGWLGQRTARSWSATRNTRAFNPHSLQKSMR